MWFSDVFHIFLVSKLHLINVLLLPNAHEVSSCLWKFYVAYLSFK